MTKAMPFATTTVLPAGKFNKCAATVPTRKQLTATAAAVKTTLRKLLQTRIAVRAGKMMSAEMSSVPIMRMPSTTVTAVRIAMSVLQSPVLMPMAREKVSSKVTANRRR